jgi:hypothetical protein
VLDEVVPLFGGDLRRERCRDVGGVDVVDGRGDAVGGGPLLDELVEPGVSTVGVAWWRVAVPFGNLPPAAAKA